MKIPKKIDPAVSFTCANCKRVLPIAERDPERLRCADRAACAVAFADWISKESFVKDVAKG